MNGVGNKISVNINDQQINKYMTFETLKSKTIEDSIREIFETEMESADSVIIDFKPGVIKRIAACIDTASTHATSIGIAGETASGKSTVTLDIIETVNAFATEYEIENIVTRVNTDDYYYDRSDMVKAAGSFAEFAKHYDLDVPQALELELMNKHIKQLLDGKEVYLPKYDMSGTAIRYDNYNLAKPSKIVISEGLFTLTEKIADAFDFKIYVDVREHVQKERFFIRAEERNLGSSANTIYKNASEKANIYIKPCKAHADIILSGEADRARYKQFLNRIIEVIRIRHYA